MSERKDWHWQPGDGMTLECGPCLCGPDAPGCYCGVETTAENNYYTGWNAAIDRLIRDGVLPE